MHPFIKEFKDKVDEIIQDKITVKEQSKQFKIMKKDDMTIGEYKKQAKNIADLKKEIDKKTYNLFSLHAPKIMQKLGWDNFTLGKMYQYKESFENTCLDFSIDRNSEVFYNGFMKSVFKRLTGKNFEKQSIKSKYYSLSYDGGDEYFDKTWFTVFGIKNLPQNNISQEELKKLVMQKQCILLDNDDLYSTKSKSSKIENKLTGLMFDYDMLSEKGNLYDKLYPELRNTIWDLIDENFVQTLDIMIVGCKNGMVNAKKQLKSVQEKSEKTQAALKELKDGNFEAIEYFKNDPDEEDEQYEENY